MRSRFLLGTAILVAGLAMASAQNATEQDGLHPRGQGRHAPGSASGATALKGEPLRARAKGSRGQSGMKTSHRGGGPFGQASVRPRIGRSDLRPRPKHNDASLTPRMLSGHSERGRHDEMASDRAILERAVAQEHLRAEQDRIAHDRGARWLVRRQPARLLLDDDSLLDVARRSRRLSDQGTGSAHQRDWGKARGAISGKSHSSSQVRNAGQARRHTHDVVLRRELHRSGRDDIRKAQAALNQQGFSVGNADGKLGKRTKDALTSFQKQKGFRPTGKADGATLNALLANSAALPSGRDDHSPRRAAEPVPAQAAPGQSAPERAAPEAAPPVGPSQPEATGQGQAFPPATDVSPPADGGTSPAPDGRQAPASARVPAGSPQEEYKDELPPNGGDQR